MLIDLRTHIQRSTAGAHDFLATLAHTRAEMDRAGVSRVMIVPWLPAQT
ncbi:hypothetical protein LRP67_02880 [Nocardioides sp. cx-169]|nr:hypothetical protein [Nocardioides sp. cx-169]MCD4533024.1 hypothetical protein [Nocardioides sp. cx-169]